MSRCQYRGCKNESELVYLGHGVCERHWAMIDTDYRKLRHGLGIKDDDHGREWVREKPPPPPPPAPPTPPPTPTINPRAGLFAAETLRARLTRRLERDDK